MPKAAPGKSAPAARRVSRTRPPGDMNTPQWQLALRRQYGREQDFSIRNIGSHPVFSEFEVHNAHSDTRYRVAIRGTEPGLNYCACRDFATNLLGTCKHIEFVLGRLEKRRGGRAALRRGFTPPYSEVFLHYGETRSIRFRPGSDCTAPLLKRARALFDSERNWQLPRERLHELDDFLAATRRSRHEVRCYADALAFADDHRVDAERQARLMEVFPQGSASKTLRHLLKLPLYPYQCEGALFAARAGRAIIADDMGLGKTIQAIAMAEILLRHADVQRILVVCPTSLRHQWQEEVSRLAGREARVVQGSKKQRAALFAEPSVFKITNYDAIHRDARLIDGWAPDLVIADEAQRIKNWDTRAARAMKQMRSRYALVLTGTPVENRLRELVSIVQFVDQHRLGPTWRFLERHQITSDSGQVVGYRDLDLIAQTLQPIMLRRRKADVLSQLPERSDKVYLLPLTAAQRALHDEQQEIVARIVARWKKQHFLSEMDQKILRAALQTMRMVCDSSYLIDTQHNHGTKIPELLRVLEDVLSEPGTKVVIFSQWLRSHELLGGALERAGHDYVLFHGGIPGPQRGALVRRFKSDPGCRVFLSTDVGGVGLNLQCASVVMNLDLPWNPAVLEQRIGRAHRLGQQKPVRVLNFVAEDGIEFGIMQLLEFKQALADGVLDDGAKEICLGGSRLEKFMANVQAVTAKASEGTAPDVAKGNVAKEQVTTDNSVADPAGSANEAAAPRSAAITQAGGGTGPGDAWQPLLVMAQQLLKELAQPVAAGTQAGGSQRTLLRRDPTTGESYLHVPVPSEDKMARLLDALRDVLAN